MREARGGGGGSQCKYKKTMKEQDYYHAARRQKTFTYSDFPWENKNLGLDSLTHSQDVNLSSHRLIMQNSY